MSYGFMNIASTPSVRAAQAAMGADHLWQDFEGHREFDRFTDNEAAFIAERDSFYMATVSETGWPYVQHRGGPRGFLKVVDDRTLAFADYRGNRQYISTGNLAADDRACLFLMDYAGRARLKIYAHVEAVAPDADAALTQRVTVPGYKARLERIFRVRLEAFDWNCPQHITPRFTQQEVTEAVRPLRERLAALETEIA
ncbi:MAG: pyridoxamine 5'-phosphate oxidase family protein, partial [Variovorax sp.]